MCVCVCACVCKHVKILLVQSSVYFLSPSDSAASQAGLLSGSCILRVGQQDVMKASHEAVVTAITQSLAESEEKTGKPTVDMKISYSKMEQLVQGGRSHRD